MFAQQKHQSIASVWFPFFMSWIQPTFSQIFSPIHVSEHFYLLTGGRLFTLVDCLVTETIYNLTVLHRIILDDDTFSKTLSAVIFVFFHHSIFFFDIFSFVWFHIFTIIPYSPSVTFFSLFNSIQNKTVLSLRKWIKHGSFLLHLSQIFSRLCVLGASFKRKLFPLLRFHKSYRTSSLSWDGPSGWSHYLEFAFHHHCIVSVSLCLC